MGTFGWKALLMAGAALLSEASAHAGRILMVTTGNGTMTGMEATRTMQLQLLGHTVGTIWDNAPQATFDAAYPTYDMVYVPNEATEAELGSKLRECPISVLNEPAVMANEFGFSTSNGTTISTNAITITNNTHQVTSGIPLGACTLGSMTYPVVKLGGSIASGATVLSTQSGVSNIVAVETGGILANTYNGSNVAFGRRLQSPMELSTANILTFSASMNAIAVNEIAWCLSAKELRGNWALNETSGTTASDSTFRVNHGTVTGTLGWTTGVRDGAFAFDYTNGDDYVTIPNSMSLQDVQEGSYTLAAWFQPTDVPAGTGTANNSAYAVLMKEGYPLGLRYTNSAAFTFEHYLTGNVSVSASSAAGSAPAGKPHHVAGVLDKSAGTIKLFVDGQLSSTQSFTANTAAREYGTVSWRLGVQNPTFGTNRWSANGMIDDARVYNYALTGAEVAQLHGFIGYWKFNEGSGTAAVDSTLMANNVTLGAGASWASDCTGNYALVTTGASGGTASTNAAFDPPAEGTVAFWMQYNGGTGTRRIFGNGGDWEVRQNPDDTVVFDLCADAATNLVSTNVPLNEVGRWYHVAITFDSDDNSFAIYSDGVLHRTGTNPNDMKKQPAAVLSFGTRTGASECWPGSLRDFRIYNRKLSAAEIGDLAGLAAYWKLDETSGTVASDSSPNANNGAVTGTATWTTGKVNNSLLLNGSTYVTVPGLLGKPKNVTLMAWASLTAAGSGGAEIISLGDCFAMRLNEGTSSRAFFYNGTTWQGAAVNATYAGVGWRHYAAVFDDDNNLLRFYVNGNQVASLSTTSSISYSGLGSNAMLGRHGNGQSNYNFTGKLDDVRVYSRALCPSEIQSIITDGGGVFQGVKILQWVETR